MNASEQFYMSKMLSAIRGLPESPAGCDSRQEMVSLCDMVRIQYVQRLHRSLVTNVKSVHPYGYYSKETVENCVIRCLNGMESVVLRECMASTIYHKSITDTIRAIEKNTNRRKLYEPLRAKISMEYRKPFGDRKTFVPVQSSYPFRTLFAAYRLSECRPEKFGSDDQVVWTLSDLVRARYLLRLREKLLDNVIRAQLDGRASRATIARCLDELLNDEDEDALKKCMVAVVYRKRMSETIKTVENSTGRRKLYEPLRAEIMSKNRKSATGGRNTLDPSTHGLAKNIHLSPTIYHPIETADSRRDGEFDAEPTAYEHSSRLESRILLYRQVVEKESKIVPELHPVLEKRPSKTTRSNGRRIPYDLQKRRTYGQVGKKHGCDDGVASGWGLKVNPVPGEEKRLPTRHVAANLVVQKLKPLYNAGFIDGSKFDEVAESITNNLINQNYNIDEKTVAKYIFGYFSNEKHFKTCENMKNDNLKVFIY